MSTIPPSKDNPAPAPSPAQPAASGGVQPVRGAKATGVREELDEREEVGSFGLWLQGALRQTPSWLVSMVFHMIVVLTLALMPMPEPADADDGQIQSVVEEIEELEELEELEEEPLEEMDLTQEFENFESTFDTEDMDISPADELEAQQLFVELSDIGLEKAPRSDLLSKIGSISGKGLDGRGHGKGGLVRRRGGNEFSEAAVAAALKWLAAHQMPNGAWTFTHQVAPSCNGQCRNPGTHKDAFRGATAMGLLPFMGAGHTHKTGEYKETVKAGLYFLSSAIKLDPMKGGSLHEKGGRMYSHGLASIALCEAYAMTNDKALHNPSQSVINFICYAQDPVGGGWRYEPRQKGDTSVVGWQIMALKSGHMAYLHVPPIVVKKAFAYLDSVQANSGANYGYTGPGAGDATTAIGLLCRMYLGWKKDNPALQRGVEHLAKKGPSHSNMYYNYYATQVLCHWEGELWEKWNKQMRDWLIETQVKGKTHEAGSWYVGGGHGKSGGRLYTTSMATMILEVYYRHMPIYGGAAVEEEFKVD